MVGSPFVRGVSGGERKRVWIAEHAFSSFYLSVTAGVLSLAGFFRLLSTLCQNYDQASRLASFVVTIMILYSGYLIPIFSQHRWLAWLSYLNPLNFAFSAAMENEFKRIDLACVGSCIEPDSLSGALPQYPRARILFVVFPGPSGRSL
ncbi:hypothetical protein JCM8097_004354 [Rhodosporidiobolus ruineniae]